jgi:hypothetical protein
MAGNPYTESGARFQIPDMLANRADTYNLGEILEGKSEAFARSYLENTLTSNPLLAPLAGREAADIHKIIDMAKTGTVLETDLAHQYSAAELEELVGLFQRLMKVQTVLLRVNQEYIDSASQDDRYRTEPPFKLQGSYRNMNKLAEKVVSVMNEEEIERLVDDHYAGESQTLTKGAEQNLLKLAEMRGRMTPEQRARWQEIKDAFLRIQRMGGKDDDPVARLTGSLSGLDDQLKAIQKSIEKAANGGSSGAFEELGERLAELGRPKLEVRLEDGSGATSELLARQLALLERALVQREQKTAPAVDGPNAGDVRLDEIHSALKELHRLVQQGTFAPKRIGVELGPASDANLFRRFSGEDVISAGGVFVATYEKAPPLGAPVLLSLSFGQGTSCEVGGTVVWSQDDLGDDAPPGFGVSFAEVAPEARTLIESFARAREPLLRDD